MRISIVTPNFNGERFLEQTIRSVLAQRASGVDLEFIVVDGASTDRSMAIIERFASEIDHLVCETDHGPAEAINKGLKLASGDVLAWLNADDVYHDGALGRLLNAMASRPSAAIAFGRCRIVSEEGEEIRRPITVFKEAFFAFSCRFLIQSINYISQPAMAFRREALEVAGPLREDLKAAWDYEFLLRLWSHGGAIRVAGQPLSDFRWHETSISGSNVEQQFEEEYQAAVADAGRFSPQAVLHAGVRWGIVGIYRMMAKRRARIGSTS